MKKIICLKIIYLLFIFFISVNLLAEIKISGVVKTANNTPLEGADVYTLVRNYATTITDAIKTTTTDKNGNYEIILDDKYVYFAIGFTAPNYDNYKFSICCIPNHKYKIDVTLAPFYTSYLSDSISIIGDFNNFSMTENTIPMTKLENGNYTAIIPNAKDTLGYQILFYNRQHEPKRSINGQQANFYKLDRGFDYISYIVSKEPTIKIEFNPSKITAKQSPSFIKSDNPAIEKIIALEDTIFNSMLERDMKLYQWLQADSQTDEAYYELQYKPVKFLDSLFTAATEKEVKTFIANSYLDRLYWGMNYNEKKYPSNKEIIKFIKDNFPITSNFFIGYNCPIRIEFCKHNKQLEHDASLYNNKLFQEYFRSVDKVNDKQEYVGLLKEIVDDYMQQKDTSKARTFYDWIKMVDPDGYAATSIKNDYDLDGSKKIIVGNTIPDFELPNVDNPSDTISMQKLRGKWVMIDVWYYGCAPCMAELPNLRKMCEKYQSKSFVIYGICLDTPDILLKTKSKPDYAMPWLNSSVGTERYRSDIANLLEVQGVPHCILIAPDGKIVAVNAKLRGKNLETTLEELLK